MKTKHSTTAVLLLLTLMLTLAASAMASDGKPSKATGLWFGTIFFAAEPDPAAPKLQMAFVLHADGTMQLDSTSETGAHPVLPFPKSVFNGIWKQRGRRIKVRGFAFDEGGPDGFSIIRGVAKLEFKDPDTLVGTTDFDFLACDGGPLDCPDPTEGAFLKLGDGAGPLPFVLKRFE